MKIYQIKSTREDGMLYNYSFWRTRFGYGLWNIIKDKNKKLEEKNKKEPEGKKWTIAEIKRVK